MRISYDIEVFEVGVEGGGKATNSVHWVLNDEYKPIVAS